MDSLYVALSSQIALERRLTTLADNVANMSTVGFRATEIKFEDLVASGGKEDVSFVTPGQSFLSDKSGPMRETGNPFDFAIQGDAWFGIDTPAGLVMTRDGRFTLLDTGQLVTHQGYAVVDAGGAPIQLDPAEGAPEAGRDGVLRQNGNLAGALGLFTFDPGPNFVRFENSGIVPRGQPEPIVDRIDAGVAQGFLEESNVNPVLEMTRLIMVQRSFDNSSAMIRDTESSVDESIRILGGGN
ncbi:MAG: flagellar basal-body rod protein FlgF [Rhizobiaceae bacterium]|nr:flagellar basal-body rod protein FlgF [Rhizobiaceae bacterium]